MFFSLLFISKKNINPIINYFPFEIKNIMTTKEQIVKIYIKQIFAYNLEHTHILLLLFITFLMITIIILLTYSKKEIQKSQYKDYLTNLPNRRAFLKNQKKIKDKNIILINVLNFKKINSMYGYTIGDKILVSIALRLKKVTKKYDGTLYRTFGDNFAVVIQTKKNNQELYDICIEYLESTEIPIRINNRKLSYEFSIGVLIETKNSGINEVLGKLEFAKYLARSELNKIAFITDDIYNKFRKSQQLEEEINSTQLYDVIYPVYQPKINIHTKNIIGVEALARWNKFEELLAPNDFIPILENNDKVSNLDLTVLKKVCENFKFFKENNIKVSVNFSIQTIEKIQIDEIVESILKENDIPPSLLEIEVTETVISKNEDKVVSKLNRLVDMGLNISLDDFTAGHSTIAKISKLPINTIKIDKELINTDLNDKTKSVFNLIKNLGKELKLDIIIEGVETKEQINFLEKLELYNVQGYYFSKPLKEEDLINFINEL